MRRRRLLLLGLAVLAVGTWLLWPRSTAITEENYGKIQVGMTLEEVEAILGGPAGSYGYPSARIVQTHDAINVPRLGEGRYQQWIDSRQMVGVQFDADHRVVGKDLGEVTPLPLWRRPLVWLGL